MTATHASLSPPSTSNISSTTAPSWRDPSPGTEELTGSDVVLVHRLLKGDAGSAVDHAAYAARTVSTLDEFAMDADIPGFVRFTENLADVGEIEVAVETSPDARSRERTQQGLRHRAGSRLVEDHPATGPGRSHLAT